MLLMPWRAKKHYTGSASFLVLPRAWYEPLQGLVFIYQLP